MKNENRENFAARMTARIERGIRGYQGWLSRRLTNRARPALILP
jgi:epoxyqueuosine reductase QueG